MLPIKENLSQLVRIKNPSKSRFGYLRLDRNESTIEYPEELIEKFRRTITAESLTIYPELDVVTAKIAAWIGCANENIFLAAGSDPAIKALYELFVEPGDVVVLPMPTYQMTAVYARMFGADLVEALYDEQLELPMESLIRATVDRRAKLVCLANPNSPTGTVFPREEIVELIETCHRQNTVIHLDEAYYHYYPETVVDLIGEFPTLVVTRTFSKAIALAAVRMGYVVAHEKMIRCFHKIRPMYETNAFAAKFCEIILDNPEVIDANVRATLEGKAHLLEGLDRLGLRYFPTHANFILVDVGGRKRSREIVESLKEKKILIGGDFGTPILERCIRIGLGDVEQMSRVVEALAAA